MRSSLNPLARSDNCLVNNRTDEYYLTTMEGTYSIAVGTLMLLLESSYAPQTDAPNNQQDYRW